MGDLLCGFALGDPAKAFPLSWGERAIIGHASWALYEKQRRLALTNSTIADAGCIQREGERIQVIAYELSDLPQTPAGQSARARQKPTRF